jgi:glycosyltransferase involved in cell wall biosynthesis
VTARPRFSVVVPVLNAAATVGDMLHALASQAGVAAGESETIIVDGGSTDGTPEIVARAGVTLLVEPKRGPGAARNTGLRAASGDIVCHVDADAVPTRRWLRELVAAFDDPTVTLVAGKSLSFPPRTPAQRYMARSGRIDAVEYVRRPIFPFAPSRNMAVRRAAALAIGGFAEECITGEDVDFSHRLLRAFPSAIVYAERAIVFHHDRETDDALARQAWSYGEGVAHLYLRYPDDTHWGARDALRAAQVIGARALAAVALAGARRLRVAAAERAELARYHWLWTWAFWRGFYSYRRLRAYR